MHERTTQGTNAHVTVDHRNTLAVKSVPPQEAAAILGVTESTLATWRSTGRYSLRFSKVGRCVRYQLADLQAFLDQNSMTQTGVKA